MGVNRLGPNYKNAMYTNQQFFKNNEEKQQQQQIIHPYLINKLQLRDRYGTYSTPIYYKKEMNESIQTLFFVVFIRDDDPREEIRASVRGSHSRFKEIRRKPTLPLRNVLFLSHRITVSIGAS